MTDQENEPVDEPPPPEQTSLPTPVQPSQDQEGPGSKDPGNESPRKPTKEEILDKLDRMPGLVAIGLLSPAKANAMKGIYQTMLANLEETSQTGSGHVADDKLVKVLRQQPEMLKFMQQFLTPDQVALITREAQRD